MVRTSDLGKKVSGLLSNPARTQRVMGGLIREISGGQAIIYDPTSPIANVLESAATLTATAIDEARVLDRKRYAIAAASQDDILRHMSDEDYIGVYSTPASGTFQLVMDLNALYAAAPIEAAGSDVRKIIIPRNSAISNGVHQFTLQYPVVIRLFPNRNVQVTYDYSQTSPIEELSSSYISSNIINANTSSGIVRYLTFRLTVKQVVLVSRVLNMSSIGGFSKTFPIMESQKFHHCRAYIKNTGAQSYTEINVTHNNEVYDPASPTALISVTDHEVKVSIPLIYSVNNLVNNTIRIDIFTCSGALDYLQGGFSENAFNLTTNNLDGTTADSRFIAAIDKLNGVTLIGVDAVSGGSDGIGFEELRERYIQRANNGDELAITPAQARDRLKRNGYDIATSIDNISDREFLATRMIPHYIEGFGLDEDYLLTVTGLGTTIGLVKFNLTTLTSSKGIADNGDRITILPSCLFVEDDGLLRVVGDDAVGTLLNKAETSLESLVIDVNEKQYLFSPFHYRIATTTTRMQVGAFQLNKPTVVNKYAVQSNIMAAVAASTTNYAITYNDKNDGYSLRLRLAVDSNLKELGHENVSMQLSFTGDEGGARQYINGSLVNGIKDGKPVGETWIYDFQIKSNMDINLNNRLIIHDNQVPINLDKEFDIVVVVRNYVPSGADSSIMSEYYRESLFTSYNPASTYMAITREKINIHFGDFLEHLWMRHRTIPEETQYRTYAEDEYLVYSEDVIEYDEYELPLLTWDAELGEYVTTIKHRAGDIQYDSNQNPIIRHAKGTVMKDEYNNPIPIGGTRGVIRQIELLLVDGKYYFATDDVSTTYLDAAVTTLGSWVKNDMPKLNDKLMERSRLRYYPKDTMSTILVTADDGDAARLPATQYVAVDVYMSEDKFVNVELKDSISGTVPKIVNDALAKTTVSVQDIESVLRTALGTSIISVKVSGLFNGLYNTVTVDDNTSTFILDKKLDIQSNMALAVVDNIDVRFHKHAKSVN